MPPAPPTLEDKLEKGSPDLRYLLTQHGLAKDHQGELFQNGVDTVAKFACFASSEDDLRSVMKDGFGIDPTGSLLDRSQAAAFVVAWQAAKTEARREVREWAKPIPQADYVAMRAALAAQFGELEEKHVPAKELIEKKLHELETGEFRAEPLTEVLREVDPEVLLPAGTLSIKKGRSRTAMPSGPEQLRLRLTVLQNALLMIKLKHPSRAELQDVTMATFEKYKDYLLGGSCYGLRSSDDSGGLIPPWTLVLGYEHAVRKNAYKLMATLGYSFGEALAKSYKDTMVKERHFTTPLALHAKRPALPNKPWKPEKRAKGEGKGDKGGKAKKKGASNMPDGKPICFRYNSKAGCKKNDKCHFAHVCMLCFGKHSSLQCTTAAPAKATTGDETTR